MSSEVIMESAEVSIHVPLAEHDPPQAVQDLDLIVSIHVPLAEHDGLARKLAWFEPSFNSRAPRGARPSKLRIRSGALGFQFTCPSRSTTSA